LDHTSNLLSTTKEDLKQVQYDLKEKDYIISEQKKAGTILSHCPFHETIYFVIFNGDLTNSYYRKCFNTPSLCAEIRSGKIYS